MDENNLLELSSYIVTKSQQLGASNVEVLARSSSEVDVVVESGEVSGVENRLSDGIAIRLYIGKRMGSAFTNISTREAADEAINMALASAKVTTEDPDWVALPEPRKYPAIKGLWNDDIAKCEPSKAVEIAVEFMKRAKEARARGRSGEHTVVMHPWAYSQILNYTLFQAVKGDNVARGKSKLEGRIGDSIAPENVTIVDDGTIPTGINSSIADDEGVPRQRTPIIEEGVLGSFLWDSYWGNKTGEESTGNARRSMRQGLVDIGPTNTVVEPGKRGIGDIFSEIDHGYLIRNVQGAHSSNPESGDFSVVGNPAILIEDGEMVGAVHGLMVAGNAFDLLGKCVEMAKEPIALQGLIGPEIVFEGVNVIARGNKLQN